MLYCPTLEVQYDQNQFIRDIFFKIWSIGVSQLKGDIDAELSRSTDQENLFYNQVETKSSQGHLLRDVSVNHLADLV